MIERLFPARLVASLAFLDVNFLLGMMQQDPPVHVEDARECFLNGLEQFRKAINGSRLCSGEQVSKEDRGTVNHDFEWYVVFHEALYNPLAPDLQSKKDSSFRIMQWCYFTLQSLANDPTGNTLTAADKQMLHKHLLRLQSHFDSLSPTEHESVCMCIA